jgi:undecaprenyl-diphosphatase
MARDYLRERAGGQTIQDRMTEPVKRVRDYRVWMAIVVLFAAATLFAVIALLVERKDPILARDLQVLVWLHTHGNPVFSAFLLAISHLHALAGMAAFTVLLAIALARKKRWHWVWALGIAMCGGMLLNLALKVAFHRARPTWDDPLISLTSNSFPSGHTAGATLFYGFLAVYLVAHLEGLGARAVAVVATAFMVALVAFARMYLGVHYPSDVLAAMSASSAWLMISFGVVRVYLRRRGRPRTG